MEATDLMIGDWVINPVHNDCSKIESVYYDKELHCLVGTDGRFPQQHFNTIPLTAEILELNGWKENSIMLEHIAIDIMRRKDRRRWYVEVSKLEDTDTYNVITLLTLHSARFVHELQHALRLCGLNELADNFKVK